MRRLTGTGVALVTPFDENKDVDFSAFKKLIEHVSGNGVDYLVVLGSTGEAATLTDNEKIEVLAFVKENNTKKLPIVCGIGGNDTAKVIKTIEKMDLSGVSAILSVSPCYNKPSQEGIYQHFVAIADASPAPVVLYNVPSRTGGAGIISDTSLRLAEHSNIIGIKEASGDMEIALELAKNKSKDFILISGDDMLTIPLISYGFEGVISVLANAFPREMSDMTNAALSSKFEMAREQLFFLEGFNDSMYQESNPVGLKYLLSELDICLPEVRLPLVNASDELVKRIQENIKDIKKGV